MNTEPAFVILLATTCLALALDMIPVLMINKHPLLDIILLVPFVTYSSLCGAILSILVHL